LPAILLFPFSRFPQDSVWLPFLFPCSSTVDGCTCWETCSFSLCLDAALRTASDTSLSFCSICFPESRPLWSRSSSLRDHVSPPLGPAAPLPGCWAHISFATPERASPPSSRSSFSFGPSKFLPSCFSATGSLFSSSRDSRCFPYKPLRPVESHGGPISEVSLAAHCWPSSCARNAAGPSSKSLRDRFQPPRVRLKRQGLRVGALRSDRARDGIPRRFLLPPLALGEINAGQDEGAPDQHLGGQAFRKHPDAQRAGNDRLQIVESGGARCRQLRHHVGEE